MNAIKLKQICQTIGCSGLDPDMCQIRPQNCQIIKDVLGVSPIQAAREAIKADDGYVHGTGTAQPFGVIRYTNPTPPSEE